MANLKKLSRNLPEHEKYVTLVFDEMKIKKGLVFDQTEGTLIGFTDHGTCFKNNNNKLASQMLGVYVKGISGSLSQILEYFPTGMVRLCHHFVQLLAWNIVSHHRILYISRYSQGASFNRHFLGCSLCPGNTVWFESHGCNCRWFIKQSEILLKPCVWQRF